MNTLLNTYLLRGLLCSLLLVLAACSSDTASAPNTSEPEFIPGQYIVTLADDGLEVQSEANFARSAETLSQELGVQMLASLHLINSFTATDVSNAKLAELEANSQVVAVEQDQVVTLAQSELTWGLDRSDQRDLPLDASYSVDGDGTGVHAYVIDTGIRASHDEFGGRVAQGRDIFDDDDDPNDCNGHGTHVAGTLGGATYGVAKNVTLHGVRVFGCTSLSTITHMINGIQWVVDDVPKTATGNVAQPTLANMSLGSLGSQALDSAVTAALDIGITVITAAGNSNVDACNYSPARVPDVITVGATNQADERSIFSNYGDCLDLFAPGSDTKSSWYRNDADTLTTSGTSMAAPHVAGAVALYLQANPTASVAQTTQALNDAATKDRLSELEGSPNLLLYLGTDPTTTPEPEPNQPELSTGTADPNSF